MKLFSRIVFFVAFFAFVSTLCYVGYLSFCPFGIRYPVLETSPTLFEAGQVPGDKPIPCVFVLQNTGSSPLVIHSVHVGCDSCIKVLDYPREPILPNRDSAISVLLMADNLNGEVRKSFLVKSNDPKRPNQLLRISAEIQR